RVAVRLAAPESPEPVLKEKRAVEAPAGTVTPEGAISPALLELTVTVAPLPGPVSVTVHVPAMPPASFTGLHSSEERRAKIRLIDAVFETDEKEAVITAVEAAENAPVEALNVAVAAFAGTVTDAGTVNAAELSDRLTTAPFAGAALESVTVHVVLE